MVLCASAVPVMTGRDTLVIASPVTPLSLAEARVNAMGASGAVVSMVTAAPIKAVKMPFKRWMRLVGWRHVVAVVFVVWALIPAFYVLNLAFSGDNPLPGLGPVAVSAAARDGPFRPLRHRPQEEQLLER